MNGFNLSNIQDAKLGGTSLSAIYLGSNKLWPTAIDYSKEYFTIESLEDSNQITFSSFKGSYTYSFSRTLSYSTDKNNWTSVTVTASGDYYSAKSQRTTITTLNTGDKLYIKGTNSSMANNDSNYFTISSNKSINISGNIMSLLYDDNFIGQTSLTSNYTFYRFFFNNYIVDASNLILSATILTNYCYDSMFNRSSNLISAPELPATTLKEGCYNYMFQDSQSLTTAPELPATTLVNGCYKRMFYGCKSLNYIKCLATNIATNSLSSWLYNVAATGTFVKQSAASFPSGDSGIPYNWTVQNI